MGRRSRNQAVLPMDKPTPVKLTDEDRAAKAHQMALKRHAYRAVKRELKRNSRAAKEEMERLEGEIDELADALVADEELRKQGDLRFEGKTDATKVLALVETRAPLPSEPHAYISPQPAGGEPADGLPCTLCGSGEADPIHPVPNHVYVGDGSGEGRCRACPRAKDDPVHAEASADPAGTTETAAENIPSTVACSRCSKAAPKGEIRYDRDVKPVCDPCRRAAVEAGTWPHPFRAGHEKAKRCADCMRPKDDAVHDLPPAETATVVDTNTTPGDTPPAESVEIAKDRVLAPGTYTTEELAAAVSGAPAAPPDPAFDFTGEEAPDPIIRSHAAIERSE